MTTNLGQIYDDVLYRLGKDYRGGFVSPDKFNEAIRIVSERKLNRLVDQLELNKEVSSDLQPFVKTYGSVQFPSIEFTPVLQGNASRGGYAQVPSDFWQHVTSYYMKTENDGCDYVEDYTTVEFVSQHEADARLRTSITSPASNPRENNPIVFFRNNLFYIYPFLRRVSMTIIREAATPYFDYDIISGMAVFLPQGDTHVNSTVEPVGSPSLTVEFEYPESCVDELTQEIVTYLAIANQNKWNVEVNPKVK